MRTALRTAVATALLAGVAVTPALTAGTAFAADAKPKQATGPASEVKPDIDIKPAIDDAGTLVRTETLTDGTLARIYKINELHHRAELFTGGYKIGVFDANTRPAAGNNNGAFFVLYPDGTSLDWTGNALPGAEPGTYELADGTLLELGRAKDGRYGLQLIENGKGRGFTYLNGDREVWTYGKAVVVLESDGGFAAYIPGSKVQAAPKPVENETPAPEPTPTSEEESEWLGEFSGWQVLGHGYKGIAHRKGGDITAKIFKGEKEVGRMSVDQTEKTVDKQVFGSEIEVTLSWNGELRADWLADRPQGKTPQTTKTTETAATTTTTQTTVVPRGGVAAGAEPNTGTDHTALLAAGAGAASLAAAGLGFVAFRRRTAGARG
ncbi:LPXTG cell wall anchor domain-containing protein [Streptomyces sp. NPDC057430]|uniref:LPXTG cell wall anchor domain-containing protein n=1 Tax=unclassified Streptomyces TaxID=2593676 RepID=UPI0036BA6DA4